MKTRIVFGILALFIIIIGVVLSSISNTNKPTLDNTETPSGPSSVNKTKVERLYLSTSEAPKIGLINELNRPDSDINEDLKLVKGVFTHFRTVFKENPVGSHHEILAVLSGDNKQQIAYIPRDHPAVINGELHDRWGTPFYFHQITGEIMEVRSAGPDKQHWSSDDIIIR